jgi:hypothetical protein
VDIRSTGIMDLSRTPPIMKMITFTVSVIDVTINGMRLMTMNTMKSCSLHCLIDLEKLRL